MNRWYFAVIAAGAVLILLPVLAVAGVWFAFVLLALWLFVTLAIPEMWDLYKTQNMGRKARGMDVRDLINGDDRDGKR